MCNLLSAEPVFLPTLIQRWKVAKKPMLTLCVLTLKMRHIQKFDGSFSFSKKVRRRGQRIDLIILLHNPLRQENDFFGVITDCIFM